MLLEIIFYITSLVSYVSQSHEVESRCTAIFELVAILVVFILTFTTGLITKVFNLLHIEYSPAGIRVIDVAAPFTAVQYSSI